MNHNFKIIAASGTDQLGKSISQLLNLPLEIVETDHFPNQELKIRLKEPCSAAILVGSFANPVNSRILEYLLIADALKRQGCSTIIGVISYLAYSKQDKVFLPGEPLSAKVVASVLQTGPLSRLYTVDLHNPSISGYFDIPVINLSATELLAEAAKTSISPDSLVVSPDAGSIKNSSRFAEKLGLTLVFASKYRDLETGIVTIRDISGPIQDKHVYIYDDMVATGSTLVELAEFLRGKGAKTINVYCTHHLYLNGVQHKIEASPIDHLTVTNTIASPSHLTTSKLTQIDIAPIIANQLARDFSHD